jgi:hypothetical protein
MTGPDPIPAYGGWSPGDPVGDDDDSGSGVTAGAHPTTSQAIRITVARR